jgi:hypothetical protein
VLAEILIEQGETVNVGVPIAMFVDNIQEYMEHVENIRIASGIRNKCVCYVHLYICICILHICMC